MKSCTIIFCIFLFDLVDSIRFTAVTQDHYYFVNEMYLRNWNEDKPAKSDPATTDAYFRSQVCEDISRSSVFVDRRETPIDMKSAFAELGHAKFFELVRGSVTSTRPGALYQFTNAYRQRDFPITNYFRATRYSPISIFKKEYVFVCLLRRTETNEISRIHVSKEYNVLSGLRVYRFVFSEGYKFHDVMLAEGSAEAYLKPDFNIELHYLALRKHHEPALSNLLDPVCRLSTGNIRYDQVHRLCTSVFASPNLENSLEYESNSFPIGCKEKQISFKTEEALEEAAEKSYRERMLHCSARITHPEHRKFSGFFISRAYNPHQVFVYTPDPRGETIYLTSLYTNVNVVRERFNFNKVET